MLFFLLQFNRNCILIKCRNCFSLTLSPAVISSGSSATSAQFLKLESISWYINTVSTIPLILFFILLISGVPWLNFLRRDWQEEISPASTAAAIILANFRLSHYQQLPLFLMLLSEFLVLFLPYSTYLTMVDKRRHINLRSLEFCSCHSLTSFYYMRRILSVAINITEIILAY